MSPYGILCHTTVQFYLSLVIAYFGIAAAWGWLCYKHRDELLPIQVRDFCQPSVVVRLIADISYEQYYLSSLVVFLVIEMVANWGEIGKIKARRFIYLFVQHTIDISMLMDETQPLQQHSYLLVRMPSDLRWR